MPNGISPETLVEQRKRFLAAAKARRTALGIGPPAAGALPITGGAVAPTDALGGTTLSQLTPSVGLGTAGLLGAGLLAGGTGLALRRGAKQKALEATVKETGGMAKQLGELANENVGLRSKLDELLKGIAKPSGGGVAKYLSKPGFTIPAAAIGLPLLMRAYKNLIVGGGEGGRRGGSRVVVA